MKKIKLIIKNAFTLVELLLVVGIIALGSVVAYITLPKVQSTARANAEATNVATIAAGIRNLYPAQNTFDTLSTTMVVQAKVIPFSMTIAGDNSVIRNSFGGDVIVEPASIGASVATGAHNSFLIRYQAVPTQECVKLALGIANSFVQVKVNATDLKTYPDTTSIDQSQAVEACKEDNNELFFYGVK